ncbi:DsbA family protein [Tropicibacter sp. S64]|uniref:DsbA family protein n=1 Tax=Tropicibacter sp. S64 TaxID=3415122 RepID=UPI003C7C3D62
MTAKTQFTYLFDPLCGWCYAAAPAIRKMSETETVQLTMMPTGLFAAPRPVATIADHAYANDIRIQELTGQRFSDAYHTGVMRAPNGMFSSLPLTRALVALGQVGPALEPRFLHAAQIARYVEGHDTSRTDIVARIAARIAGGAVAEADLAAAIDNDPALAAETDRRIVEGQRAMQSLGLRGVPQLVIRDAQRTRVVDGQTLYAGGDAVLAALDETV